MEVKPFIFIWRLLGKRSHGAKLFIVLRFSAQPMDNGVKFDGSSSKHPSQDSVTKKVPNSSSKENMAFPLQQGFPRSVSQNASDADSKQDKFSFDEGTLCWNLLISRIFFDIKRNVGLKGSIRAQIQNEVCAFEVDAEYSGGILLEVETRLEVSDKDFQKSLVDSNSETNSVENVSSNLLEGYFGKHLNLPEEDEADPKVDGLKGSKATPTSYASQWKSVVNSLAKQVSQVPLSLSIRVASLRGTLRLYIKPPPSDQLWFGFTSMPDIEFGLEPSVGEHKITSGHIALFLISRFKAAIGETMVHAFLGC
ncbi:uncharacterized protein LOC120131521 [Hibiscus syriacus]|uniref:uncharacterized protein LOC120131521 n=1 Tax=Hibiscus syriacus TaxID=106335 RepID=UPI0019245882|nr:uncharacterized protein LOC120131521 [Hibiscus syriacus]